LKSSTGRALNLGMAAVMDAILPPRTVTAGGKGVRCARWARGRGWARGPLRMRQLRLGCGAAGVAVPLRAAKR
jgi:hypothetical protein